MESFSAFRNCRSFLSGFSTIPMHYQDFRFESCLRNGPRGPHSQQLVSSRMVRRRNPNHVEHHSSQFKQHIPHLSVVNLTDWDCCLVIFTGTWEFWLVTGFVIAWWQAWKSSHQPEENRTVFMFFYVLLLSTTSSVSNTFASSRSCNEHLDRSQQRPAPLLLPSKSSSTPLRPDIA
jgi:hypothetical protein